MFSRELGDGRSRLVCGKIHDDIAFADDFAQVIAKVNPADELDLRVSLCTSDQRASHAAFRAADDNFDRAAHAFTKPSF
jgi:hypothetical protein